MVTVSLAIPSATTTRSAMVVVLISVAVARPVRLARTIRLTRLLRFRLRRIRGLDRLCRLNRLRLDLRRVCLWRLSLGRFRLLVEDRIIRLVLIAASVERRIRAFHRNPRLHSRARREQRHEPNCNYNLHLFLLRF
jgi:hypothetical protein